MVGQTISHYKILEKLGEGGMGVVYKAHDTKLGRFVALKFLPQQSNTTREEKDRFIREARAAASLNHPNVCSIIDIQEAEDRQFIVMDFIDGENLKSQIRKGEFSPERVVDTVLHIAEGLRSAHDRGIVHRDIKPENIMLARDGRVKIMDFGLAKLTGDPGLTKAGAAVGTITYMSPEQIQAMDVDHRTDLWSLGVVMYEMITGKLPFQGEHEAAVMYEILNVDPKAPRSLRPDVPEHLGNIISRLLQKDVSRRPDSAGEIIAMLQQPVPAGGVSEKKSVAVLYFENMSPDRESDYFCAGMTEDIITDLSKIKELNVVSRTDVLPFRNREVNTRQVGESLRVNYILEGSVRKAGNKIRITAQLIDVKTGYHVWAERYDRLIEDIFDLQDSMARSIVQALRVSLTDSEKESLGKKPTQDLRAYDFYMRGREQMYRRGKKNNERAIQMFENAVALDIGFAAAYAGLAEAYSYMFNWYDGDAQWLSKTIDVSQKALTIDPQSEDAIFGLAMVYFHQKRFAESMQTLEKVIHQKPEHYDAHRWLGIISDINRDYDAAIRYYNYCAVLKPYSEEPWMHLDMTYRRKGEKDESERANRKLIEVGWRKLEVNPDDTIVMSRMAGPYAHFGEKEKAYRLLGRVLEIDPGDGLVLYNCACTYAVLGDEKEALTCLKKAIDSGYKNVREWVKSDPDFESLRENPEFKTLIAQIR